MERLSTGSKNFDMILRGGLPLYSLNVIGGVAGTGKTVLAHQILFFNANPDEIAIYITTMSASVNKILNNIMQFSFFDARKVSSSIFYDDAGELLAKEGLTKFIDLFSYYLKHISPRYLVIDGFEMLSNLAKSPLEYQRFLYELAGLLGAFTCTSFWLGDYDYNEILQRPESDIADNIIYLSNFRINDQDKRSVRILKLGGSDFLSGEHSFTINEKGLQVYPRFVMPKLSRTNLSERKKISWGIPLIDKLFQGGPLKGSSTLIRGVSGVGKTLMGLQFIQHGLSLDEPGLIFSFQEDMAEFQTYSEFLGWDLNQRIEDGQLFFLYVPPIELNIDEFALLIVHGIRNIQAQRVFFNSFHYLQQLYRGQEKRFFEYLYSLIKYLHINEITSVFSWTVEEYNKVLTEDIVDNILVIDYMTSDLELIKTIKLVKSRGVDHLKKIIRFDFKNKKFVELKEKSKGIC